MADFADTGYDVESGLPLRQRVFCDHYLTHLTPTNPPGVAARKAYVEAGYTASTPEIALINATQLLEQPNVKKWLDFKVAARSEALGVRADHVLLELVCIATAAPNYYTHNKNTGELEVKPGYAIEYLKAVMWFEPEVEERFINRVNGDLERIVTTKCRFRLHDKLKALQMLCQHLGLTEAELPPLEVLLNRLPPNLSKIMREMLKKPAGYRPEKLNNTEPTTYKE